jgi:hypothetical protein
MAQPYNYSIRTPNIGDQFAQGYNQMAAFGAAQQAAEQRKQQQEQAALMQQKLTALAQNPNPSAQDYIEVANMLPKEQADSLRASFTTLTEDRQRGTLQFSGRTLAALSAGNNQVGIDMLKSRALAERNSGNIEDAKFYEALAQSAQVDPVAVRDSISVMMSTLPGGKEAVEAALKVSEEQRKRKLAPVEIAKAQRDLDLTNAQVLKALKDVEVADASLQKSALELAAMEAGTLPPEKKFDKEQSLNQEYYKRTEGLREGTRNFNVIKESASSNSGAGDIALVTSFMKMLDPGSVVRETEFANARDTASLLDKLKNQKEQIETGKFLTTTQRKDFIALSQKYLEAAEREGLSARRTIETLVKNYNLNPENVFGPPEAPVPPEAETEEGTETPSIRARANAVIAGEEYGNSR